jgi:hypothetical protein
MHRTPEDLRRVAEHCRHLASSCITDAARRPLNEMAEELERKADDPPPHMRTPLGGGRY